MALHDSLRDLVSVRGPGVVDEAEELRGALDDFLAEDEATLGEMNLLVDAVRLGALRRMLAVLQHGADPEAAVREAGAGLARDRGTDDPTRSCWALAALGFALGRVDEALVRTFRSDAGTVPAPGPPTAPHGRSPDPAAPDVPGPAAPVSATGGVPATPVIGQPSASVPQPAPPSPTVEVVPAGTLDQRPTPVPPPPYPERRTSRAGTFLFVVLVALILGGLVAAGVILLRDDDDPAAGDDPSDSPSVSEGPRQQPPLVPPSAMLVPYVEGGLSRVYQVDTKTGAAEQLTPEGADAKLPTISPDRRTMTYVEGNSPGPVVLVDLATQESRILFESGPCSLAGRPAWSPDGSQIAVLCAAADEDEEPDGIWLADADGGNLRGPIIDDEGLSGSPTWISESELVYGLTDQATGEVAFWRTDAAGTTTEQLPIDLDGHLSHIDWSPEAQRLLVLVAPEEATDSVGDIYTLDEDGLDPQSVVEGFYAHPVWSPDGRSIGGTVFDDGGVESAVAITLKDDGTGTALVVPDQPAGEVGVPVWGSR